MGLDNRLCGIRHVSFPGLAVTAIRSDGQGEQCLEIPADAISVRFGCHFSSGDHNTPTDMVTDKSRISSNRDCQDCEKTQ